MVMLVLTSVCVLPRLPDLGESDPITGGGLIPPPAPPFPLQVVVRGRILEIPTLTTGLVPLATSPNFRASESKKSAH